MLYCRKIEWISIDFTLASMSESLRLHLILLLGSATWTLAKLCRKILSEKKSNFKFQNRGNFREKNNEITIGRRPFFERTSEAKCTEKPLVNFEKPLANLKKPLANECGRRVHLTTTPLSCQQASEASGNELPPYLPPSLPKKFL